MAQTDNSVITPLFRIAKTNRPLSEIMEWVEQHRQNYSVTRMSRTLHMAGMEDLAEYLIAEIDVSVGDNVRSRSTARIGKIIGIHPDGSTVDVKWSSGGVQPMSKEYLVKLGNKEDTATFKKYTTKSDAYAGMDKPNIFVHNTKEQ